MSYIPSLRHASRAYCVVRLVEDELKRFLVVDEQGARTWTTKRADATRFSAQKTARELCTELHASRGMRVRSPYRVEAIAASAAAEIRDREFRAASATLFGRGAA